MAEFWSARVVALHVQLHGVLDRGGEYHHARQDRLSFGWARLY